MSNQGSGLGVFLLGAVAGAVAGLLTTPRSGREIREFLRSTAEDLGEGAQRVPGALKKAGTRMMESGKEAFEQARQEIGGANSSSSFKTTPRTSRTS